MPGIDFDELDERGYTVLHGLVDTDALACFETAIDAAARAQAAKYDIPLTSAEPFIDVMKKGGPYRTLVFGLAKYLRVLHQMCSGVNDRLEKDGFFDWSGQTTPLFWSTLRADLPGEDLYLLPMHQDFGSIRCEKSWRLWVPLRPVDADSGTMEVVVGSHRLGPLDYDFSDLKHTCVEASVYEGMATETIELSAGQGVLINSFIAHRSVPNQSDRVKYVLLVNLQDLATMVDPDDPEHEIAEFIRMAADRDADRKIHLAEREVQ